MTETPNIAEGTALRAISSLAVSLISFTIVFLFHSRQQIAMMSAHGAGAATSMAWVPLVGIDALFWTAAALFGVGICMAYSSLVRREPATGLAVTAALLNFALPWAGLILAGKVFPFSSD